MCSETTPNFRHVELLRVTRTCLYSPIIAKVPSLMKARIGVDTGGTFTDLLCLDERGLRVHKLRSTPSDPSLANAGATRKRPAAHHAI